MHKVIFKAAVVATAVMLLGGCASDKEAQKMDYKRAVTLPPLEVPPDLTAPESQNTMQVPETGAQSLSSYEQGGSTGSGHTVLPTPTNVKVMRDGTMRWLVVQASPEDLWSKLRNFWAQQGMELKRDDPRIGIMETQWAENRADIPEGFIRGLISKVFKGAYSASTRDKYRIRLERGNDPNTTEIYLTQYGVKEVPVATTTGTETADSKWVSRPSDPELANEMLNRLLVFLGTQPKQAEAMVANAPQPAARAHMEKDSDGRSVVVVEEEFARAWRRVGIALDRLGLVVEDRDRSQGIYFVRLVDNVEDAGKAKKGFLSGLFSSDKDAKPKTYRVVVRDNGETSVVAMRDANNSPDDSDQAKDILTKLESELR